MLPIIIQMLWYISLLRNRVLELVLRFKPAIMDCLLSFPLTVEF